ncbi:MAG: type II secretion system protein GspL [Sulfitobacter sp.]|nr:type II secretion system protein GspL [Sulfitobacter sp.]
MADSPVKEAAPASFRVFDSLLDPRARGSCHILPAELVVLHAVELPMRSARQKLAALPFALEEGIGHKLEQTHVAHCGSVIGSGQTLAATVDVGLMERALAEAGSRAIIAEQFLLPLPEAEKDGPVTWICYRDAERVLVRASDGTGFAADAGMLLPLWQLAGKPPVQAFGKTLPKGLMAEQGTEGMPPQVDPALLPDLRQGQFRPDLGLARPLKWLAALWIIAALGQLGVAAADAGARRDIADDLRATAQAALAQRLPAADVESPPELVQRQLAAQNQPQVGSAFLPLMNRISDALAGQPDQVQFRQLSWSDETVRLTLEAPDLDALQRAEARLADAGLRVSSGSATAEAGAARADLTVRP